MRKTKRQIEAIETNGNTLVVACPGSGKTRVLSERAVRLIAENPSNQIQLVTFTREAANELTKRVRSDVGMSERINASTFHSIALRQLKARATVKNVISDHERDALIHRALSSAESNDASLQGFQAYVDNPNQATLETRHIYEPAYEAYLASLLSHRATDLNQLMIRSLRGMEKGTIVPIPRTHILIDEFQDIDQTQLDWVLHHYEQGIEITAVGDDDQSIYKFRHALGYRAFRQLEQQVNPSLVYLDRNHRCPKKVLDAARMVIECNQGRLSKTIGSDISGGRVAFAEAWTQDEEIEKVIAYQVGSDKELAIIARTHALLEKVASELDDRNIPYHRPGGKDFWDLPLPSLLVAILQRQRIDPLIALTLNQYASPPQIDTLNMYLVTGDLDLDRKIEQVTDWMIRHVVPHYTEEWHASALSRASRRLFGFHGPIHRRVAGLRKRAKNQRSKITLLTMHTAKGLEFENVWLFGCNDGRVPLIPKDGTISDDDVEEERRLFYVAMTRAKSELTLSFSWNRRLGHPDTRRLQRLYPSRYINEDLKRCLTRPATPDRYQGYRYINR